METVDYLGYKIIYFPGEFELSTSAGLQDKIAQVKILKNDKEIKILKFIVSIPTAFAFHKTSQEIMSLVTKKAKEMIKEGYEEFPYEEFELTESGFVEVIDTTK